MQRSRSRTRPRYYDSRSPSPISSRSRSHSRSRAQSASRSSRPSSRSRRRHHDDEKEHILKASAGLLAGIGIAAVVAHKFWPKGVIHGGKEDWETRIKDKIEDKKEQLGEKKDKLEDKIMGRDPRDERRGREPGGRPGREINGRGDRERGDGRDGRTPTHDEYWAKQGQHDPALMSGGNGMEYDRRARSMEERRYVDARSGPRERAAGRQEVRYYRRDGSRAHPDEAVYIVERGPRPR